MSDRGGFIRQGDTSRRDNRDDYRGRDDRRRSPSRRRDDRNRSRSRRHSPPHGGAPVPTVVPRWDAETPLLPQQPLQPVPQPIYAQQAVLQQQQQQPLQPALAPQQAAAPYPQQGIQPPQQQAPYQGYQEPQYHQHPQQQQQHQPQPPQQYQPQQQQPSYQQQHQHQQPSAPGGNINGAARFLPKLPQDGFRLRAMPFGGQFGGFKCVQANASEGDVQARMQYQGLQVRISGFGTREEPGTLLTMMYHHGGQKMPIYMRWMPNKIGEVATVLYRCEKDAKDVLEQLHEKLLVAPFNRKDEVVVGSLESLKVIQDQHEHRKFVVRVELLDSQGHTMTQLQQRQGPVMGQGRGGMGVGGYGNQQQNHNTGFRQPFQQQQYQQQQYQPPVQPQRAPTAPAPAAAAPVVANEPAQIENKLPSEQDRKSAAQRFVPHPSLSTGWMATSVPLDTADTILNDPSLQLRLGGLDAKDVLDAEQLVDFLFNHSAILAVTVSWAGAGSTEATLGFKTRIEVSTFTMMLHERLILSPFNDQTKVAKGSKESLVTLQTQGKALGLSMVLLTCQPVTPPPAPQQTEQAVPQQQQQQQYQQQPAVTPQPLQQQVEPAQILPKLPPSGELLKLAPHTSRGGYTCLSCGLLQEMVDLCVQDDALHLKVTGLDRGDTVAEEVVTMLYYHTGVVPVWFRWFGPAMFHSAELAFQSEADAATFTTQLNDRLMVNPNPTETGKVAKGSKEALTAISDQHLRATGSRRFTIRVEPYIQRGVFQFAAVYGGEWTPSGMSTRHSGGGGGYSGAPAGSVATGGGSPPQQQQQQQAQMMPVVGAQSGEMNNSGGDVIAGADAGGAASTSGGALSVVEEDVGEPVAEEVAATRQKRERGDE